MITDDNQLALVPHTYQGSLIQQRADDGYINATAMCKAAGREWSAYRRLDTTEAFVTALEGSLQIHRDLLTQSIVTGANDARGTWVHPQVAIYLAQWLSPEFAVKVTEWVYEWISGKHPSDKVWQQFEDRVSLVYDNVPEGYFCIFRESADLFAALIANGATFGTRMILDISIGWHWGKHWRDNNLEAKYGPRQYFDHNYPKYFPQAWSNPQAAACYPEESLPEFRRWMRATYTTQKMPAYLSAQVAQKKLPAKVANDAMAALEQRDRGRAIPRLSK